ncbi:MAG: hypothetical protein KJ914_04625 [Gammaproteobacteria bacterium]|nr:hypothetical protein [Gammaproteobacteria bacterium]MBU2004614.1 hypothetical protein [Gammaproteobacteria bacterium]
MMMKAIPQSMKRTTTKTKQASKLSVGLDIFGNAIPEVKSALVEGTGKALRIVRRQDVIVKPSRKKAVAKARVVTRKTALVAASPTLLGRLIPWIKPVEQPHKKPVAKVAPVQRKHDTQAHPDGIGERLEYAFRRLHQEFNEREQQLEAKMQELKQQHQHTLAGKTKSRAWLAPVALAAVGVVGYMMYVMTSMQTSMTAMSGNINTMNGHMGVMAGDTQVMSQNIQTMNQSMYYMNNNVAYMSGNVAQMNQKVGTLAQAAQPMGEAASAISPFTKMFKSFMPF